MTHAWYENPGAREYRAAPLVVSPRPFHESMPGYAVTPLVELPELAADLGVGRVFVKDESRRLGMPAFKILGASFAVARELSRQLGVDGVLTLDEIRPRLAGSGVSLVAATDGNHGRAVARVASLLGIPATVYAPSWASQAARDGIRSEGARVVELDVPYDDVVRAAASAAGGDAILIQDTSWAGYETIPQWIVDAYDTMAAEIDEQVDAAGAGAPDLVVVPSGVGSLAQAVVAHYRRDGHRPAVLVVEPDTAACTTVALNEGRIVPVPTAHTIMTGLNCGTLSEIAWPDLAGGLDGSATVSDEDSSEAVQRLSSLGVDSGPCGAAALAAAAQVLADHGRRRELGVTADAVVVLLSTEGRAANPRSLPSRA